MRVSAVYDKPKVGHTDSDCPWYPEETRPVTEEDRRTGVRLCNWCRANGGGRT